MVLFWVVVALLTGIATTFVVWPLLARLDRTDNASDSTDEARRLAVYRDRRREIETEREAGRLTAEEAQKSLDELHGDAAVQFSAAGAKPGARDPLEGSGASPRRIVLVAAMAAAVLIPLSSLALYAKLGAPELVAGLPAAGTAQPGGEISPQAMEKAIRELKTRVDANPGDGDAWANLASAYKMQGDLASALPAYEKATSLVTGDARLLADHAEAIAMATGGQFNGKAIELLERGLAIDPTDLKSLILMGVAQFRAGNVPRARLLLSKSVDLLPPDSEDAQQIRGLLSQMGAGAGASAQGPGPRTSAAPQAAASGAKQPTAAPGQGAVTGTITIDESLRKQVPPGATLFLVARAQEGPRTPLAVARLSADALPQAFQLGDAQAMDPNRPMSASPQVIIEARVSASGTAMRQSGDLFGTSKPVKPGASGVTLRIDQRVP